MSHDLMPDWVHQELMNWKRFCDLGKLPHPMPSDRCGSAEKNHQSPREWGPDAEDEPRKIPINMRHAKEVDKFVMGWWEVVEGGRWVHHPSQLSQLEKDVLLTEYPQRANRGRNISKQLAADRIGVSVQGYDRYLQSAAQKVARAFEKEHV